MTHESVFMSLPNRSPLFRPLPLIAALAACLCLPAQAQSLTDMFNAARSYDATYQSTRSQYDAGMARAEQAQALLLPTVGLSAAVTQNKSEITSPEPARNNDYGSRSVTLSATQPLYRAGNWASYAPGKKQSDVARLTQLQADQDLVVRVSTAYFDVLAATDNLTFVRTQKQAVAEQLASAKRNFEVGTSTITDTREAQARFDLAVAQELAADNDLRVKSIALDQLVGRVDAKPKPLQTPVVLPDLVPDNLDQWVSLSQDSSPAIQQLVVALDVAKLETQKAESGHKPTVDLTASYTTSTSTNGGAAGPAPYDAKGGQTTIGVALNLPLFAGFSVQNRVKETLALEDKARTDLEAAKRSVALATRTAFLGVQSGKAQVKALEAAEASSQSALDASKLGYQVGVRINIDVLNSQSQLYDTKTKLAKARYDVLVGALKLRQAAGTLTADDLNGINALLAP